MPAGPGGWSSVAKRSPILSPFQKSRRRTTRVFQSESTPALQIRAQWRTIGAVTEWIPILVNNAPKPSGKVSEVRSLAASWPTRGPVDLGSFHSIEDFLDRTELDIGTIDLMPDGGRSSDGVLPFFALTDRHDSLALGIGWSVC